MTANIEDKGYAHPEVLVSTDWVAEHSNDFERPRDRIERGHAALSVRPHSRRRPRRLDVGPERSDPARLHHARGIRGADVAHRRDAGHDGRLLRRQEQLVGVLCLLGLPAVRPHQGPRHGRRPDQVGEGRPAADPGRPVLHPHAVHAAERSDTPNRAFRETCWRTCRREGSWSTCGAPRSTPGTRMHMPDYPNEGALRGGHIPGARSIPWARAVNPEDGTFKTAAELRKIYCDEKQLVAGPSRRSRTAASASAAATAGSRSSTCSASRTSGTTTGPGRSGAIW